jgi:hypothetical protein
MIRNYASCLLFSKSIKSPHPCQIRPCNSYVKTIAGIFLAAFILTADSTATEAQQAAKIPRMGYLTGVRLTAIANRTEAFRQGPRELGYVEGKTLS